MGGLANGDAVKVLITNGAIDAMLPPSDEVPQHRQRLNKKLDRFSEIASRKFDAHKIEKEGSILIDRADVLDFSQEI